MIIELIRQTTDVFVLILIVVYIGIPLLGRTYDLLVWIYNRITGKEQPEEEVDEQKRLLEESKAFMHGRT